MRSIITGKWVAEAGGSGKCRPLEGVARRERQGGWVGGVQRGPRLRVGDGVQQEWRLLTGCGTVAPCGVHQQ